MPTIVTSTAPAPYLRATDEEIRSTFAQLQTREEVAEIPEVTTQFLRWLLFVARSRQLYEEMELPKRHGGVRRICIPPNNIRILHDKLLRILTAVYRKSLRAFAIRLTAARRKTSFPSMSKKAARANPW